MKHQWTYHARIERWIDGDTVVVIADLGFHSFMRLHIRLKDVHAPEIRGPQRTMGLIVHEYCKQNWPAGADVIIETSKDKSFNRWIGVVYSKGININERIEEVSNKVIWENSDDETAT